MQEYVLFLLILNLRKQNVVLIKILNGINLFIWSSVYIFLVSACYLRFQLLNQIWLFHLFYLFFYLYLLDHVLSIVGLIWELLLCLLYYLIHLIRMLLNEVVKNVWLVQSCFDSLRLWIRLSKGVGVKVALLLFEFKLLILSYDLINLKIESTWVWHTFMIVISDILKISIIFQMYFLLFFKIILFAVYFQVR